MKKVVSFLLITAMLLSVVSCGGKTWEDNPLNVMDDNYRTYYEVFVYSFYDSNEDGIGDLKGLTEKLDYINDGDDTTDEDLGCNGIWLMPIMPSTSYHKYDVIDYYEIDPEYGTMEDFDVFLAACNERGIKVILDFVMNHTSSKHEWFTKACDYLRSIGDAEPSVEDCKYVDYYNFTKDKVSSTYYEVSGTDWYYEGSFWSEMPDLNLFNEDLRRELEDIAKFWLDKGVHGFRLDAVKEFVSDNTPDNVAILTWFNDYVKSCKEDAYLVGECWTNMSTYTEYYASGMDSIFNFKFADVSGTIASVVRGTNVSENATTFGKALMRVQELMAAQSDHYIDAPFYTNHDLARSAGYYPGEEGIYRVKMSYALSLLMTGSSFLYYGEELGMKGSGRDENKRAPMQWSSDANATGMCDGPRDMEDIEMTYGSLEEQMKDKNSIYNFFKKVIKLRNQVPAIARGEYQFVEDASDNKVCVLKKVYDEKEILMVYNISMEPSEVDLTGVTLNGANSSEWTKLGELCSDNAEKVTSKDGVYTMPKYSILVFGTEAK